MLASAYVGMLADKRMRNEHDVSVYCIRCRPQSCAKLRFSLCQAGPQQQTAEFPLLVVYPAFHNASSLHSTSIDPDRMPSIDRQRLRWEIPVAELSTVDTDLLYNDAQIGGSWTLDGLRGGWQRFFDNAARYSGDSVDLEGSDQI